MATYPTAPRSDFLLWCQQHAPVFAANAVAIGLTTTQATTFTTNTNGAADATLDQENASEQ